MRDIAKQSFHWPRRRYMCICKLNMDFTVLQLYNSQYNGESTIKQSHNAQIVRPISYHLQMVWCVMPVTMACGCVFKWLGQKFLFHTSTQPRVQEISRVYGVGTQNTRREREGRARERERRERANAKQKVRTIHPRMIDCHPTLWIPTACTEPLRRCEIMMRGYHEESRGKAGEAETHRHSAYTKAWLLLWQEWRERTHRENASFQIFLRYCFPGKGEIRFLSVTACCSILWAGV